VADGKIVFLTKIDNTQVERDLKQLENKVRKSEESISRNENAKLPLVNQAKDLGAKLDAAKASAHMLREEMAAINNAMAPGSAPDDYAAASVNLTQVQAALKAQEKEVAVLQKQWDSVNNKIDTYDAKIKAAQYSIEANTAKAAKLAVQLNSGSSKMSAAFATAKAAAARFEQRIISLGKRVLVFSVIAAAFRAIKNYMDKALKTNEEYTAQLAQLKAALVTAFQPIYEFILPGLLAVMKVLTSIVMVVANVLSALGGKTLAQSAENAKALNKEADAFDKVGGAAKEASKSLANFDEINTLSSGESGGPGGGGPASKYDFSEFDTAQYKAKIDELTVYLSGALLAIGAILAFSGANIPLGISLMAAGALGMAAVVKENWGKMSDELKGAIAQVMFILGGAALVIGSVLTFSGANLPLGIALMAVGAASLTGAAVLNWNAVKSMLQGPVGAVVAIISGALLAIGAVLTFSGANLPLGIALMVLGAAGLTTTAVVNWKTIESKLKGPVGAIVALVGGALLVIGAILAFSGVNLPLGIALMAAGGASLVTVTKLNWNAIRDKLKEAWEGIKSWFNTNVAPKLTLDYWKTKWANVSNGLKEAFKNGINGAIALFNQFIFWINSKMNFSWPDKYLLGKKIISAGSIQLITIPQIPYLAQGAVLPPNKPFMAMVGDQKNGTNVEAPLATIQEALANVLAAQGTRDINITFTGDLAQLARVLKPVIDRENNRVGGSLAKGVF
jgi:hypothetical protein